MSSGEVTAIFTPMGEYSAAVLDRVFSAVSDPTRRAILARLADSDARVTDVASAFPISLNSTSKHIRVLEGAGLVRRTGARSRAHPDPGRGTARRRGGMDRALPPVLERPARRARRLRHRRRQRGGVVVTSDLHRHRPAGDRRSGRGCSSTRGWTPRASARGCRPAGIRETRAETDPRVGGDVPHRHGRRRVLDRAHRHLPEIDRPRRLVFTWSSPATQFRDSIVTVTFQPSRRTRPSSRSIRSGCPDEDAQASHHGGWSDALRELARIRSPPNLTGGPTDDDHRTATRDEWLAARLELLKAEKELTRLQRRPRPPAPGAAVGAGRTRTTASTPRTARPRSPTCSAAVRS